MAAERPLDLWQLSAFLSVLDRGSFSRAARTLGLAQPTVSLHVSALEESLGEPLIERGPPLRPTAAGAALLPVARQLLALAEDARTSVRALTGLGTGLLRLGSSTVPSESLLPRTLARFRQRHPLVSVMVKVHDTDRIVAMLRAGEVELALTGESAGDERLIEELVMQDAIVLVVPPGHPFLERGRVTPAELVAVSQVTREEGSATRRFVERGLSQALGQPTTLRSAVELDSSAAVIAAARAGVGPAFASRRSMENELLLGQLIEVPVDGLELERGLFLAYPAQRYLSPAARAFVTLVVGPADAAAVGKRKRRGTAGPS